MEGYFFVFNLDQCVGCHACQLACQVYNGTQEHGTWRQVYYPDQSMGASVPAIPLSMACNHCIDAPCLKQCPTTSIRRDPQTGAVLIDEDKCIGCGYCIWNCPYEAPVYNPVKRTMEKCHFCNDRLHEGLEPACVSLCPTDALRLGKGGFSSQINLSERKGDPGPKMSIEFQSMRSKVQSWNPIAALDYNTQIISYNPIPNQQINFTEEWPLWLFTLMMAFIVPLSTLNLRGFNGTIQEGFIVLFAVLATSFSLFHLGRPQRAWRAISNIRSSWLSREIFFLGLFMLGLVLDFALDLPNSLHLLTGLPLLFIIDRVYRTVSRHWTVPLHSGQVWLIGLSTYLLLHTQFWLFLIVGLFRLFLFLYQTDRKETKVKKEKLILHISRIILLMLTMILLGIQFEFYLVFLFFVLGEALDRYDFYTRLRIQSVTADYTQWLMDLICKPE